MKEREGEARNPYAAPKARLRPRLTEDGEPREARFEPMRMSLVVVILLSTVTLGFYAWWWLFTRRRFIDSLDSTEKVGTGLLTAAFGTNILATMLLFASSDFIPLRSVVTIGSTVLWLIAVFRIARILRVHFSKNGIRREVSGIATFFLTTLYLQYVFNRAADDERAMAQSADRERRRKKKRKKRAAAMPEIDEDEDEATSST